ALAVARVAVRIVGGLAIDADAAGFLVPAHDAVVRDVAPKQTAPVAHVDRALVPAAAARDLLDAREAEAIFGERRIEVLHVRIGIALARLPSGERLRRHRRHR